MNSRLLKKFAPICLAIILMAGFNLAQIQAQSVIDSDNDGLIDIEEIKIFHTNPYNIDSDNDGYNDYLEIYHGYSPRHSTPIKLSNLDSDKDDIPDSWEIRLKTDLLNFDSDNDGYSDGIEITNGYNPKSPKPEKLKKLIKVNLDEQMLTYFFNNIELEKFLISSGVSSMPTPTGQFTILDKLPIKTYGGNGYDFYYPNTKWNLHFTTQKLKYYIHGAYWHDNFGQPMSHGCVNVAYDKMERLYNFTEIGTEVEID